MRCVSQCCFLTYGGREDNKKPARGKNNLKGTQNLSQDPQQTSHPQTYLKSRLMEDIFAILQTFLFFFKYLAFDHNSM